ncbi:hypothetical protein FOCC_FOCC006518 [Frankliniella occidentalis]|nr:hypothetical protein FOCC_FOCC006518 [Frankliniella occidentalis]
MMLTDDEVVEVTTARKSLDYDALNNNKSALLQAGRSPLSRQDSSSDEEFLYLVLTCCDCKDLFPTSYQLLLHRLDAHSDRRAYQCPACMATFKRPDLLAEHRATHTESQPHACEHCGARFTLKFKQRSNLNSHTRRSHPIAVESTGAKE